MASAAGVGAGGSSGEGEGEEQEDPSSSHSELLEAHQALEQLSLDDAQHQEVEDELSAFRAQWQRELETTPSPYRELGPKKEPEVEEPLTEEDKAKQLFRRGVELERCGKLYEAIEQYKRAMQILPDVETRLYEGSDSHADTPEEEEIVEEIPIREVDEEEDEDTIEGEELAARFQRILDRKGRLCEPMFVSREAHISCLPYEVFLTVMRWVVSADLDAAALEKAARVCRGFYLAARDPLIWRALCIKTWGIECGSPRANGFGDWRHMYVARPRLLVHGCYISKTTYLRHGENNFQDHFYRPWYLIDYYRYLRFFPEGLVLMWTTAEEPGACVAHLRHRAPKAALGVMAGHYRLMGTKVVIFIKKTNSDKKTQETRFRARRKESNEQEQTFHLELELHDVRSRRNWMLCWRHYAVAARGQWTQFELQPSRFPPFMFSRVRHYTADPAAPLPAHF